MISFNYKKSPFNYPKLFFLKKKLSIKISRHAIIKNSRLENNTLIESSEIDNCEIRKHSYVGKGSYLKNCLVGKFTSIGPNVKIGLGEHPTNFISTHPIFYSKKNPTLKQFVRKNRFNEFGSNQIGNDVWIGANAIVIKDLSIGDGVIVAAGSVVTTNLDDYGIYGGVPAKLLKYRFTSNEILKLKDIKWWDKNESFLRDNHEMFSEPNIFFKNLLNDLE